MRTGRPTVYSKEILKKAREYLDSCEDTEMNVLAGKSARGTELFKTKLVVNLPMIEALAPYLGVHKDTLYEWEKIHPEFSDVLDQIRAKQAKVLVNKGLSGEYSPIIAKLLLASKHGMTDKTDITSAGEAIKGNTITFADFEKE